MLLSELESRDIAVLGAGREGLAAWRWLRRHFPEKCITVYDELADDKELAEQLSGSGDRLVAGPFEVSSLQQHDLLIRSPGISPYRNELIELRELGVPFSSATNLWFAQHPDAKTICITGTKGKSTTSALVAHLLKSAGCVVRLAGNIGQPLLGCPDSGVEWWVIELSSYQLVDLDAQPGIAAILNLSDEHLDWHGGSRAYRHDKLRLASLAANAPLVANHADEELLGHLANRENVSWFGSEDGFHVSDNELWFGRERFDDLPRQSLPGPHNLANLAAALTIVGQAGYQIENLAQCLGSFTGLPHRLQSCGQRNGIRFVNDSLSTTPVATVAALEALDGERVILLVGGMDRGVDWRPLMPHMKEHLPFAVLCLPDNGPGIARVMNKSELDPPGGVHSAASLDEAMTLAAGLAMAGDTVLLSPGAPSFPRFRDYEERGRRFTELAGL